MDGYDHATYGDRFASVYDDWYDGITDAAACAALVAELADLELTPAAGPVLELGRRHRPAGHPARARWASQVVGRRLVAGDARRLAAKPGGGAVEAVLGDMADPPPRRPGRSPWCSSPTTRCSTWWTAEPAAVLRSAARRLLPGGSLRGRGVRARRPAGPEQSVAPRTITADRVVLSVSQTDPDRQEAMGQYVDITEAGIKLRPWHIRWSTPDQLDAMAAAAGLVLADRWPDWARTPVRPRLARPRLRYTPAD